MNEKVDKWLSYVLFHRGSSHVLQKNDEKYHLGRNDRNHYF